MIKYTIDKVQNQDSVVFFTTFFVLVWNVSYPILLTAYPSGAPEFTPGFWWGSCCLIFSFMCMFCRSVFILLSFFFWLLCCLSFDLRILITPFSIFKLFLQYSPQLSSWFSSVVVGASVVVASADVAVVVSAAPVVVAAVSVSVGTR